MSKKCKYCLKIFHVFPSRKDRIKYCSVECRRLGRKKRFCKRNHDTSICGRTNNRACRECTRFLDRQTRINNVRKPKQICKHGHDTFVTGRDTGGHCRVCLAKVHRKREKIRRKTDLNFRIACTLRGRLKAALKENWKTGSAIRDLGCSMDFLVAYLQDKFYGKMTWDNWGTYWEIDHIKELADFDLSKRSQLLKAVNYTNLRPLTKPDHWEKSAQAKRDRKNKS